MAHRHSHEHPHDHSHEVSAASKKVLLLALIITGIFMLVELIGGLLSGSLALIADAGHMLTDTGALLMAFAAVLWSSKAADSQHTYGYGRLQVLAAFTNGIILIVLTIWILIEAIGRFQNPQPIESLTMFIVAVIGLVVNIIVFRLLHGSSDENINIRGAMLHVLGDLLGSVGAILAAMLIYWRGWLWADPLLSILVSLLILRSAWQLIKDSSHILLEGKPPKIDVNQVKQQLKAVEGVIDVRHIHAWSINEQSVIMTLHALIDGKQEQSEILDAINARLYDEFGVEHSTIQLEPKQCQAPDCE